ncbi:MAG: hypothetical protein ABGY29_07005 [bacterium]
MTSAVLAALLPAFASESGESHPYLALAIVIGLPLSFVGYLLWTERRALSRWRRVAGELDLEIQVGRRRATGRNRSMKGTVEGVKVRVAWGRSAGTSRLVGPAQGSSNLQSGTRITVRLPAPIDPVRLTPDSIELIEELTTLLPQVTLDSDSLDLSLPGNEPTADALRDTILLLARRAGQLSSG